MLCVSLRLNIEQTVRIMSFFFRKCKFFVNFCDPVIILAINILYNIWMDSIQQRSNNFKTVKMRLKITSMGSFEITHF